MDFLSFCDRAMCAPDTQLTDAQLLERYKLYHNMDTLIEVKQITEWRDEFWDRTHSETSVTPGGEK